MMPDFREEAMSVLSYDPETGKFHWKVTMARDALAGQEAGRVSNHGYCRVGIAGRKYLAHRLAWLFMTGAMPPKGMTIDHINRNRVDNRWANLRLATMAQNTRNGSLRSDSASGEIGVAFHKAAGRWRAYVKVGGKQKHLGLFDSIEEARDARVKAAQQFYGAFSPHREGI